jgi:hypothetical protein
MLYQGGGTGCKDAHYRFLYRVISHETQVIYTLKSNSGCGVPLPCTVCRTNCQQPVTAYRMWLIICLVVGCATFRELVTSFFFFFTAEPQVESQVGPSAICGRRSGTRISFLLVLPFSPVSYRSTGGSSSMMMMVVWWWWLC